MYLPLVRLDPDIAFAALAEAGLKELLRVPWKKQRREAQLIYI